MDPLNDDRRKNFSREFETHLEKAGDLDMNDMAEVVCAAIGKRIQKVRNKLKPLRDFLRRSIVEEGIPWTWAYTPWGLDHKLHEEGFQDLSDLHYEGIVLSPPFSEQEMADHFEHATLLSPSSEKEMVARIEHVTSLTEELMTADCVSISGEALGCEKEVQGVKITALGDILSYMGERDQFGSGILDIRLEDFESIEIAVPFVCDKYYTVIIKYILNCGQEGGLYTSIDVGEHYEEPEFS